MQKERIDSVYLIGDEELVFNGKPKAFKMMICVKMKWCKSSLILREITKSDGSRYFVSMIIIEDATFYPIHMIVEESNVFLKGATVTLDSMLDRDREYSQIHEVPYGDAMRDVFSTIGMYFDIVDEVVEPIVAERLSEAVDEEIDRREWAKAETETLDSLRNLT